LNTNYPEIWDNQKPIIGLLILFFFKELLTTSWKAEVIYNKMDNIAKLKEGSGQGIKAARETD